MAGDQLSNYLPVLRKRQITLHRNLLYAGGLFLFTILFTTGLLLLTGWDSRSVYIMGGFNVLIVANFLMSWVRLEITKENIELVEHLQNLD